MTAGRIVERDYQNDACNATMDYLFKIKKGVAPLIVAPTGAGKTVILNGIIKRIIDLADHYNRPKPRILVLAHKGELITQGFESHKAMIRTTHAGIACGALNKKQINHQVVFATYQTVLRSLDKLKAFNILIVDEAHTIPSNKSSSYQRIISRLRDLNPLMKIIGLTATPYRLDSGSLIGGEDDIFDGISYNIPLLKLLNDGWISPLLTRIGDTSYHLGNIRKSGRGEFILKSIQEAIDNQEHITSLVMDDVIKKSQDREGVLIFASGIDHAKFILKVLHRAHESCELVTGETTGAKRKRILVDFKRKRIKYLVNVDVLTTGFDAPHVDHVVLLRPTQSTTLYVQMLGRGMRLSRGKQFCLISDYCGNVSTHGPIDEIDKTWEEKAEKEKKDKEIKSKECPQCLKNLALNVSRCPACGFEFGGDREDEEDSKITPNASQDAVISKFAVPTIVKVVKMDINIKENKWVDKPNYLQIIYNDKIKEQICFDHANVIARKMANKTWLEMTGGIPLSVKSVKEAYKHKDMIRQPSHVEVKTKRLKGKKYDNVAQRFYKNDK